MDEYVLNPAEEEVFIYNLDEDDSNLPVTLSKGPYYESLEGIPIRDLFSQQQRAAEHKLYEAEREAKQAQLQAASPTMLSPTMSPVRTPQRSPMVDEILEFDTSPEMYFQRGSPPRSPRREFGLGDDFLAINRETPTLNIRRWKIIQSVVLTRKGYRDIDDNTCNRIVRDNDNELNFVDDRGGIYFCFPATVLYEYAGLYRIQKPFAKITRELPGRLTNTAGQTIEVIDLYAGPSKVGSFEAPRAIKNLPGQFYTLPSDVQTLIMSNLEPLDLIHFCNVSMKNRQLCQDPLRSVWTRKLLQINPQLDMTRIGDPFKYFMRYYYGGTVLTFGSNDYSELGRNTKIPLTFSAFLKPDLSPRNDNDYQPSSPRGDRRIVDPNPGALDSRQAPQEGITEISCGDAFTAVVTVSGVLYTFGNNDYGQLGRSADYNRAGISIEPILRFGVPVVAVACGTNHTIVLLKNGQVSSFGSAESGKLGRLLPSVPKHYNQDNSDSTPVIIPNIERAVAVACGHNHSVVLLADGRVLTFGDNREGQLGRRTEQTTKPHPYIKDEVEIVNFDAVPGVVDGISTGFQIACGKKFTLVVLADGRVVSFGENNAGQLGRVTPIDTTDRYDRRMGSDGRATLIPEFRSAVNVSCRGDHAAVLLRDGRVVTFGYNDAGQLGRLTTRQEDVTPRVVEGISTATAVACADSATLVLLKNGTVMIAGSLVRDRNDRQPPAFDFKLIPKVNTAIAISGGSTHAAILTSRRGW